MKATIPYIEHMYDEFNKRLFGGKLPGISIKLSDAKTFLGQCSYKKGRLKDGGTEHYGYTLRISTRFDLPENVLEDVIIHEMIHYYIEVNGIRDTAPHGMAFVSIMNKINSNFGRHVAISHRATTAQKEEAADKRPRLHVVAIVEFGDGRTGFKVLPRIIPRITAYYNRAVRSKGVSAVRLYMTDDPYFNRYPVSSVYTVHIADGIGVMKRLNGATQMACDGKTITPCP